MKSTTIALVIAALTLIGTVSHADARPHSSRTYVSGYRSCGKPIYTERYFIGYDRCGTAVWGYRTVRPAYRPVVRSRYHTPCPPPVHYGDGGGYGGGHRKAYSSGRVVLQGSICR